MAAGRKCAPCAAAAARRAGKNLVYVWTGVDSDGGTVTMEYEKEIAAKAKVLRKGGSYTVVAR